VESRNTSAKSKFGVMQIFMPIFNLQKRNLVTLNLDYKQMGVGGDTSWGDRACPHPEYCLPVKEYSYSFRLRPFSPKDGTPLALSKIKYK
jgi:beta-galactosidase